jgi:hypothetical protein
MSGGLYPIGTMSCAFLILVMHQHFFKRYIRGERTAKCAVLRSKRNRRPRLIPACFVIARSMPRKDRKLPVEAAPTICANCAKLLMEREMVTHDSWPLFPGYRPSSGQTKHSDYKPVQR